MKRYLLFSFDDYYPGGGTRDLVGAYDSVLACLLDIRCQNANILDTQTMTAIDVPRNMGGDQLLDWAKSLEQQN